MFVAKQKNKHRKRCFRSVEEQKEFISEQINEKHQLQHAATQISIAKQFDRKKMSVQRNRKCFLKTKHRKKKKCFRFDCPKTAGKVLPVWQNKLLRTIYFWTELCFGDQGMNGKTYKPTSFTFKCPVPVFVPSCR